MKIKTMLFKRFFRLSIDIGMFCLMLFLMSYPLTRGLYRHGVCGVILLVLFVLHHWLNLGWYRSLLHGRWTSQRILLSFAVVMLIPATLALLTSSLVMAGEVFSFVPFSMPSWGQSLHTFATAWIFVLMSFHLGIHGTFVHKQLAKLSRKISGKIFYLLALILLIPCFFAFIRTELWRDLFILEGTKIPPEDIPHFLCQFLGTTLFFAIPAQMIRFVVGKQRKTLGHQKP